MPKSLFLAIPFIFSVIGTACAQQNMSYYTPDTKWEVETVTLNVLLDGGWFINTVSGQEGEVLTLFKEKKFMRCVLKGSNNPNLRLEFNDKVSSICQKLN